MQPQNSFSETALFVGPFWEPNEWALLEKVYQGPHSELWLARERNAESVKEAQTCIIKILTFDIKEEAQAWIAHGRALTNINHWLLAEILDVFVGQPPHPLGSSVNAPTQHAYMAIKTLQGQPLNFWTTRPDRPSFKARTQVLATLAHGLDELHSLGFVHGDIKPQNIVLTANGPRLVDYDFSSVAGQAFRRGLSQGFAAPELLNFEDISAQTDRFAFAATVLNVLSDEPVTSILGTGTLPGQPSVLTVSLAIEAALHKNILEQDRAIGILRGLRADPANRPRCTEICPPDDPADQQKSRPGEPYAYLPPQPDFRMKNLNVGEELSLHPHDEGTVFARNATRRPESTNRGESGYTIQPPGAGFPRVTFSSNDTPEPASLSSEFDTYISGFTGLSDVAAPLLAGAAVTLMGVVIQAPAEFAHSNLAPLLLLLTAACLVVSVQCGMRVKSQDPTRTKTAARSTIRWMNIGNFTYSLGIILLWLAAAVSLAPRDGSLVRWAAVTLAVVLAAGELVWATLEALHPRKITIPKKSKMRESKRKNAYSNSETGEDSDWI